MKKSILLCVFEMIGFAAVTAAASNHPENIQRKWLGKLERRFRAERRRDFFRSPLRGEAAEALKATREAARAGQESAGALGGEGKR